MSLHNAVGTGSHLAGQEDFVQTDARSPCPHAELTRHKLALIQKPHHHISITLSLN